MLELSFPYLFSLASHPAREDEWEYARASKTKIGKVPTLKSQYTIVNTGEIIDLINH